MKGRRHIFILGLAIGILVLGSCRPRGVLSSSAMRSVLVDLHKADAMMQIAGLGLQDREAKSIYYAQVLSKHGITQAQFDSSLVWYTAHPHLFDKIYPKVMTDLKEEENRYAAQLAIQEGLPPVPTEEEIRARYTIHEQLDTTFFELLGGYYPIQRTIVVPDSTALLAPDSAASVQDTVNEFLPEVSILGGGVVDTLEPSVNLP